MKPGIREAIKKACKKHGWVWKCPKCDSWTEYIYDDYCGGCGKKTKWEQFKTIEEEEYSQSESRFTSLLD